MAKTLRRALAPGGHAGVEGLAMALHCSILSCGFELTDCGRKAAAVAREAAEPSEKAVEGGMPEDWNACKDEFAFVYRAPLEWDDAQAHVLVRCAVDGGGLVARAARVGGGDATTRVAQRRIAVPSTPPEDGWEALVVPEAEALLNAVLPEQPPPATATGSATATVTTATQPQPSEPPQRFAPPPHVGDQPFPPPVWAGVGASDLDPFGPMRPPPNMPGNLVGPDHPMFSGGIGGGVPGHPRLPPGVPPGARFDPYGPPGMPGFGEPPPPMWPGQGPRGRRGDLGEPPVHPDIQHRPPTFSDDMYM